MKFNLIIAIILSAVLVPQSVYAAVLIEPDIIDDPSYPSGTPLTPSCSDSSHKLVAYRESDGVNANGGVNCGDGTHPWEYWFDFPTLDVTYILVETDAYSGVCANTGGSLAACRAAGDPDYLDEQQVCMGTCEEDSGGGTGSTTDSMVVDNPVQNLFMGFILFYITLFFMVWFFKKSS